MAQAGTILLAEGSDDSALIMQAAFRDAGITNQLLVLHDGEEVLAYLGAQGKYADRRLFPLPFLAVLDRRLPLKDGLQVLEWIVNRTSVRTSIKIVILSSTDDPPAQRRAAELGVSGFFLRPFGYEDLVSMVGEWKRLSLC